MKMINQERTLNPHPSATENNRRKHRRILIDLPSEYRQLNSSESHFGCAMDISEGGLLLYLPEKVQVGQKLNIFIFSGELKCIEAIVQVAWKDGRSRKNNYRIGVKFVNISSDNVNKIKKILNHR